MKTRIGIGIVVALCFAGCDSDAGSTQSELNSAESNAPVVVIRKDVELIHVPDGEGGFIQCVYSGWNYDGALSCNWDKYNAEGKVQP